MLGVGVSLRHLRGTTAAPTAFSPASLFANGEAGVWYDPSDLSTMFTDTAGTTPATVGDPVARINDKSGNGLHATQATTAKQPILRQAPTGEYYLEFDGVDDFMAIADSPGLRGANMTLFAAVNLNSVAGRTDIFSCGNSRAFSTNNWILSSVVLKFSVFPRTPETAQTIAPISAGDPYILLAYDQGSLVFTRVNGSDAASFTGEFGEDNTNGAFLFASIDAGGVAIYCANGKAYGFLAVNRTLTSTEIGNTETYLAAKTGVTL